MVEREHHSHTRHHGLALLPAPSDDPKDPLRWPRWLKYSALVSTSMVNFTSNFAGAGLSVATNLLGVEFQKSANQVNALLTINFLLLGIGNLFWVPIAVKFGNRASLLTAYILLFVILIWTAKAQSFASLLAARSLSGFVSAAGESVVPVIVADIFFLHERAASMSIYTILISSSSAVGPLVASFMVQYSPGTWRDFSWVCAALAGFNVLLLWLFYPESNFKREDSSDTVHNVALESSNESHDASKSGSVQYERVPAITESLGVSSINLKDTWFSFATVDHSVSFSRVCIRPFIMLASPAVLLAIFIYGTALAAQIILIFAFPNLLMVPPYNFTSIGVGLMEISAIIGFILSTFLGGYIADVITSRAISKQAGAVFPAQRLLALMTAFWVAPTGCIVVALACDRKLHWVAIAFGFGMVSFNTVFAPNIAITYVVETHPRAAGEALVCISVFKNLVAFLFLYTAVDWVNSQGWLQVYMIMFLVVSLSFVFSAVAYVFHRRLSAIEAKIKY